MTEGNGSNWDWKNTLLGALEWCPCGCALTRGELALLELGQYPRVHGEGDIAVARKRLEQKNNTFTGRGGIGIF